MPKNVTYGDLRERWQQFETESLQGGDNDTPVRDLTLDDLLNYLFPQRNPNALWVEALGLDVDDDLCIVEKG